MDTLREIVEPVIDLLNDLDRVRDNPNELSRALENLRDQEYDLRYRFGKLSEAARGDIVSTSDFLPGSESKAGLRHLSVLPQIFGSDSKT